MPYVFVVGGAVVDINCRPLSLSSPFSPPPPLIPGTSNPAAIEYTWGGVGRNIAEAAHRLGIKTFLISAVGSDVNGRGLLNHMTTMGLSTSHIASISSHRTGTYVSCHDGGGEMIVAYADMGIFDTLTTSNILTPQTASLFEKAEIILLDGNLPSDTISGISQFCHVSQRKVWFECVSVVKCLRAAPSLHTLTYLSGNEEEILTLFHFALSEKIIPTLSESHVHINYASPPSLPPLFPTASSSPPPSFSSTILQASQFVLSTSLSVLFLTLGSHGAVAIHKRTSPGAVDCVFVPALLVPHIASVSGAGDSFVGGCLASLSFGRSYAECLMMGITCASLSLTTSSAISPSLNHLSDLLSSPSPLSSSPLFLKSFPELSSLLSQRQLSKL